MSKVRLFLISFLIIILSVSLTSAWWNSSYANCKNITIPTSLSQDNVITVGNLTDLTFANITEVVIVNNSCNSNAVEVKSTVLSNGSDWAYTTWLSNLSGSNATYSVYYNNPTNPVKNNQLVDSFCEWNNNCSWTEVSSLGTTIDGGLLNITSENGHLYGPQVGHKNVWTKYYPRASGSDNPAFLFGLTNYTSFPFVSGSRTLVEVDGRSAFQDHKLVTGPSSTEYVAAASVLGIWYSAFVSIESSNTTFFLYNDTELVGTANSTLDPISNDTARLTVGKRNSFGTDTVDFIRAYDLEATFVGELNMPTIELGAEESEAIAVTVNLTSPANGNSSTNLSQIFNAVVETTSGVLNNATLFIWDSVSSLVYSETETFEGGGECYQEYANVSTSCGGLETGLYLTNFTNAKNTYDGNYDTSGFANNIGDLYYANYTIPANTVSVIWQLKAGFGGQHFENYSVPGSCIGSSGESLQFKINRTSGLDFECKNSTDWVQIYSRADNQLSEEAIIWNLSGYVSNSLSLNYTFSDYGDYTWNVEGCNNGSSCAYASSNFSLSLYNSSITTDLSIVPTSPSFAEHTNFTVNTSVGNNSIVSWCNFTLEDPAGDLVIDNVNGTVSGDLWTSSNYVVNLTGDYIVNVTCANDYGDTSFSNDTFNITYEVITSPDTASTYTFGATQNKNETNTFTISLFDDSNGSITYNLASDIEDSGNFTLDLNESSVVLDRDDNSNNTVNILFSINGSNDVANGTYIGNISITNSTFNQTYIIPFEYGINPPSGIIKIFAQDGITECQNDLDGDCGNTFTIQQGSQSTETFVVNNTGFFNLSGCVPYFDNNLAGVDWISFSNTSFGLGINESLNMTITFAPTGSTQTNENDGDFYIECESGNLLGNNISSTVDNRPKFSVTVSPAPGSPTGGGGGGTSVVVVGESGAQWTMQTSTGSAKYQFNMFKGSSRTSTILFENLGSSARDIEVACEGPLCDFISFESKSFTLPLVKDIKTTVDFTLSIPETFEEGDYLTNIIAIDESGNKGIITVEVNLETFSSIVGVFNKLFLVKDFKIFSIPYIVMFMFIATLSWAFGYFLIFKRVDLPGAGALSLLLSLLIGFVSLLFI